MMKKNKDGILKKREFAKGNITDKIENIANESHEPKENNEGFFSRLKQKIMPKNKDDGFDELEKRFKKLSEEDKIRQKNKPKLRNL